MNYVIGAVVGLLWGAVIAWVNSRINKSAIAKNTTKALMPFSFEATIVATAAALGMLTVYFAFRLSKPEAKPKNDGEQGQE